MPEIQVGAVNGSRQDSYEYVSRLCPAHHGAGMVASTSFEAALLVPEPTVVTM